MTQTYKVTLDDILHGRVAVELDCKRLKKPGQQEKLADENKLLRLQFVVVGRLIIVGGDFAVLPLDGGII